MPLEMEVHYQKAVQLGYHRYHRYSPELVIPSWRMWMQLVLLLGIWMLYPEPRLYGFLKASVQISRQTLIPSFVLEHHVTSGVLVSFSL